MPNVLFVSKDTGNYRELLSEYESMLELTEYFDFSKYPLLTTCSQDLCPFIHVEEKKAEFKFPFRNSVPP